MRRTTRRAAYTLLAATAILVGAACTPPPSGPTNQAPLAIFTPSASTGNAPLTVSFDASNASDPDGTIVAWNWDFGLVGTGSGVVVDATFPAGTHTVTLTVTDNLGKTASSSTVITSLGPPPAPTGLQKTGSGCCDTYGDFAWNAVPGATQYQITLDGFFGGGCVTDHSATVPGPSTGRVQAFGLCLGSKYDVSIRAYANGMWGPWSPSIRITL